MGVLLWALTGRYADRYRLECSQDSWYTAQSNIATNSTTSRWLQTWKRHDHAQLSVCSIRFVV